MAKSFDDMRKKIGEWLQGPYGGQLWDLMTALRGPDSPSERSNMSKEEHSKVYNQRRARKRKTVEVIRGKAFFGVVGDSARHRDDDHVTLPPEGEWDHFDNHVARVTGMLGLKIETEKLDPKDIEIELKTNTSYKDLKTKKYKVKMSLEQSNAAYKKFKDEQSAAAVKTKIAADNLTPVGDDSSCMADMANYIKIQEMINNKLYKLL